MVVVRPYRAAKATVYRRWASREDLVADALESLMLPAAVPAEVTAARTLREDLIATLAHSSACLQPQGRRFSTVLAAATDSHPQITDTLRGRYIAGQREGITVCLHRAQERGEITAERVNFLLAPDRMEIAAAVGVMVLQEHLLGAVLDMDGIARLVDQVLLPLLGDSTPCLLGPCRQRAIFDWSGQRVQASRGSEW
ncbi:TetR-like C-terminal domain-containing protein [Streptomyces tauricus]|uniref:TetR-like C-terminal domain-containing protein n=1 Tax=Streptomyces tauricus TaxID=68274 RepID=UPI0022432382|nr:TetR-like C-terminal domain-containing protein [Streptomyces tauricus]MCW8102925.1 TetR/AcrR family transcriptional regulator C-terminal ligand-binding domain-containing protein [Streptomyces tauricus]